MARIVLQKDNMHVENEIHMEMPTREQQTPFQCNKKGVKCAQISYTLTLYDMDDDMYIWLPWRKFSSNFICAMGISCM